MKGLTLTTREQSRIQVLNGVIERQVSMVEAAELMRVSERHAWRLLATYRKEGAAGVAHGNRGRRPSTATSPETQEQVRALAKGRYAGFNHSHLTELLAEREGVRLSRSTVRRVLLAGGVRSPRRRRARKRYLRRERYPQEGMLLQIDGSRHDWLEGRGPRLTLIGAVDDATGTVPFALFREQEDAHGYLLMLKEIIERRGVPMALYSDRHSIFQRSPQEVESRDEQLQGRREPTQFARALEELGITLILAHTPQAKGRVERAWDTFQDRLVSEMRLAGAATIEEANRMLGDFLPRYDRQFGVAPAQPGPAYRPLPPGVSLDAVCASSTCALWPTTTPSTSTAPRCRRSPMGAGPATLGPASKSKSGWTAASWSSTRAGPWPQNRPPPGPSRSGPALAGAPTVSCRPTRQPDQPVTVTAHRQLLPVPRRRPRPASPPSQRPPTHGGEHY